LWKKKGKLVFSRGKKKKKKGETTFPTQKKGRKNEGISEEKSFLFEKRKRGIGERGEPSFHGKGKGGSGIGQKKKKDVYPFL